MDATASVAPKQIELPRVNANTDPKPAETARCHAATAPAEAPKPDTAATTPAAPAPATATAPAVEPVKVSTVPAADQPVADKLREQLAAKNLRYFDRKGERQAVEKFYSARDYAPVWTSAGSPTATAKGVIARLKDAPSEGLNASDYPLPDFAAATSPEALADAELKAHFQHARLCAPGAERPHALLAGVLRHSLSRASDRSGRSAGERHRRQGRFRRARELQSAHKSTRN